jgi:hypothetical protein
MQGPEQELELVQEQKLEVQVQELVQEQKLEVQVQEQDFLHPKLVTQQVHQYPHLE